MLWRPDTHSASTTEGTTGGQRFLRFKESSRAARRLSRLASPVTASESRISLLIGPFGHS